MSFAHVDPVLWSSGGHLLLTIDGTTLCQLNRSTGRVDWSAGIAARPLQSPGAQVTATDHSAYAASHGLLRRISLADGECQWNQFLGSTADQWGVARHGGLIAAWPIDPPAAGAGQFLVLCDARTGRLLQRMAIETDSQPARVCGDEHGWLVWTQRTATAYRVTPETAASVDSELK